jgi:hypothetical protein
MNVKFCEIVAVDTKFLVNEECEIRDSHVAVHQDYFVMGYDFVHICV